MQLPLLLKWVVVSFIAVALCFSVAYLVRKIPKADKVLEMKADVLSKVTLSVKQEIGKGGAKKN